MIRVLGYVRRSTSKQGISVAVQVQQLRDAAELIGWDLEIRCEDVASAGSMYRRPILAQALADLKAHRADALAVSKLDRLSRDVADFSGLLKIAEREDWHVICMDLGVDTTSIAGRSTAQMRAVFAEMERRLIGQRTREGMARIKAETGKHMGRPSLIPAVVQDRILLLHNEGRSACAIARLFNEERVDKGPGCRSTLWHASHIIAAVQRARSAA